MCKIKQPSVEGIFSIDDMSGFRTEQEVDALIKGPRSLTKHRHKITVTTVHWRHITVTVNTRVMSSPAEEPMRMETDWAAPPVQGSLHRTGDSDRTAADSSLDPCSPGDRLKHTHAQKYTRRQRYEDFFTNINLQMKDDFFFIMYKFSLAPPLEHKHTMTSFCQILANTLTCKTGPGNKNC